MTDRQGWFKHSKEHGLASKGIKSSTDPRTRSPSPNTTQYSRVETKHGLEKEQERILQLFADRNYHYTLSSNVDNNGIFITKDQALSIMKYATPNGCGKFDTDDIEKLSEVHEKSTTYMIKRDDGCVMILVKGTPKAHPGQIREWIGACSATTNDDNIVTYKWAADGKTTTPAPSKVSSREVTKEEKLLMEWANEVNTGQTDKDYPTWVREGNE